LVTARALQGVGGALLTPASLAIIQATFADRDRTRAIGAWSGLSGTASAVAPLVGGWLLAAGGWRSIKVWELETGYERCDFRGFEGDAFGLTFTPDGRALASAGGDTNVLIWDMTGGALTADPLADKDLVPVLWKDLAGTDGPKVHRAIWSLVARPAAAVAHIRASLKPAAAVDADRLARLIADLGSDQFLVRQKATQELQNLGELAEAALERVLADPPSLEVRRRAEGLLQKLAALHSSPERLQALRAIEMLEYLNTPEARALLRELTQGGRAARITREARASLERLRERTIGQEK